MSPLQASNSSLSNSFVERSELKDWSEAVKLKRESEFLQQSKEDFSERQSWIMEEMS